MNTTKIAGVIAAEPVRLCEMDYIDHDEWMARRAHGPNWKNDKTNPIPYISWTLTGSEMASVVNASPWRTNLELFNQKKGILPKFTKEENAAAKLIGNEQEEYLLKKFERERIRAGKHPHVTVDKTLFQCGSYCVDADGVPIEDANGDVLLAYKGALADIDGLVTFEKGDFEDEYLDCIVECKTTENMRALNEEWKKGIVPEYYVWQARWYMFVLNKNRVWFVLSYNYSEEATVVIPVDRDMDIERIMIEEYLKFIHCLETDTAPETESANHTKLREYFEKLNGLPTVQAKTDITDVEGAEDDMRAIRALDERMAVLEESIKTLKEQKDGILCKYLPILNGGTGFTFDNENFRAYIEVKPSVGRDSVSKELLPSYPEFYEHSLKPDLATLKGYVKDRVKELTREKKEVEKQLKKKSLDAQAVAALTAEAADIETSIETLQNNLEAVTVKGQWNGTNNYSVSFYDPKAKK